MSEIYGKLTVIEYVHSPKPGKHAICECVCGRKEVRCVRDLRSIAKRGYKPVCKACFSAIRKLSGRKNRTHGFTATHSRLYDVHRQMLSRCSNPSSKDYKNYGARGISVCELWLSLASFVAWAESSGYRQGLTLERIDVNSQYAPENCTWIENAKQAHNTRKIIKLTLNGRTEIISEWSKITGISCKTIKNRIRLGWNVNEILTTAPVIGRNQFSVPISC